MEDKRTSSVSSNTISIGKITMSRGGWIDAQRDSCTTEISLEPRVDLCCRVERTPYLSIEDTTWIQVET